MKRIGVEEDSSVYFVNSFFKNNLNYLYLMSFLFLCRFLNSVACSYYSCYSELFYRKKVKEGQTKASVSALYLKLMLEK